MKADQKYTPKYWVVHDKTTDDVFLETMNKTRSDAIETFADIYGVEEWTHNGNTEVILIEINMVDL